MTEKARGTRGENISRLLPQFDLVPNVGDISRLAGLDQRKSDCGMGAAIERL